MRFMNLVFADVIVDVEFRFLFFIFVVIVVVVCRVLNSLNVLVQYECIERIT